MSLGLVLCLALTAAPTDAELTGLGQAIAADLAAGRDPVSARFGYDEFFERSLPGVTLRAEVRSALTRGLEKGLGSAWGSLAAQGTAGTTFRYSRNVTLDGLPGVQVRVLYKDEGGFNVVEFPVVKNARGELVLVDIFDLSIGTLRSADTRLVVLPALERVEGNVLTRLLAADAPILGHLTALKDMNVAIAAGRPAEAITLWKSLPEEVREHRLVMNPYLTALAQMDDPAAYQKALGRFLSRFPKDPAIQVRAMDYFMLTKEWDKSLTALAVVEKRVGHDAWFDVIRAQLKTNAGKPDEARKYLEAAVAFEPGLRDGWVGLISLGVAQKKYADVARWMQAAEKSAGLAFDLKADFFKEFAASKQGKAWVKAHAQP